MYAQGLGVQQSYREAIKWFQESAEQGDPSGEYGLALLYYYGHGADKNFLEAGKWFNLAAKQNYPGAQKILAEAMGLCDTDRTTIETLPFCLLSAQAGDPEAQRIVGFAYSTGNGLPMDEVESVKWYRKAAEKNETLAQILLAMTCSPSLVR
jgi:hypothetical protein